MSAKSTFVSGVEELLKLEQESLNEWALEYYKYNYDPFFSGSISDHYPSDAIAEILRVAEKLKAPKFARVLRLAICHVLRHVANSYREKIIATSGTEFDELKAGLICDILKTISRNRISEAASSMISMIDLQDLQAVKYKGVDLHFLFLKSLPDLYESAPPDALAESIDRDIERVLQINIRDPLYAHVCYRGLWHIDISQGWKRLPQLVSAALRNPEIKLEDILREFVDNSVPSDLKKHFDDIVCYLMHLTRRFREEDIIGCSGNEKIDTPSKLLISILTGLQYYTIWPEPEFEQILPFQQRRLRRYSVRVQDEHGELVDRFATAAIIPQDELLETMIAVEYAANGRMWIDLSSVIQGQTPEFQTAPTGPPNKAVVRSLDSIQKLKAV